MNEQLIGDLFAEAMRQMTSSSSREFSQKFAELIVQECADLALRSSHREDDMGAIIANKIKQHFGVK